MSAKEKIQTMLTEAFGDKLLFVSAKDNLLTVELPADLLKECCLFCRDNSELAFKQLTDIAGIDYLHYGVSEWTTTEATSTGFGRGAHAVNSKMPSEQRFAVVYHLISLKYNIRLRLRVFAEGDPPKVPSVTSIWAAANWFEREAFDLFGILFEGHTDLRRILTDYGFIGHPFRKDFPLSGTVEMRYDAKQERVIYEPVSIEPRVLVPKTIRADNRYSRREEG